MQSIEQIIAQELNARPEQVRAAVALLDEGATVPFIARYRKEATGGLDDTQLRNLEERLRYLRELEERREAILKSVAEQDKLSPALEKALREADTKTRLEDLYLPYKPKRRTRAQMAREAGLEPLADALLDNPALDPQQQAAGYLNEEHKIATAKDALDGAKQILMERFAENAELLTRLRTLLWDKAEIQARVAEGKEEEGAKFRDYFEHHERLKDIPSHRALALFRGRNESVLHVSMALPDELENAQPHPCEAQVVELAGWRHQGRAADDWLGEVMRWTWKIKLNTHLETELLGRVRELAEEEAIQVFARNLKSLLMASPAGPKCTMGLDPGLRTGVKVVVVDATGKLLEHTTVFPHQPRNQWDKSLATLVALSKKHGVQLIAIGNGTASRETDKLAGEVVKALSEQSPQKIMVSEAGASVYSASELAAREFPDLDVSFRGAVSIARRLQDPLAELVKIDPKSIGVGQYQHDVSQVKMSRSLDAVVEDCVNAVGVDVNTASAPLLARIAGLNGTIAGNIVSFREKNGAFACRDALKQVPRLGDKTFEQAAGFLRIMNGDNPLDGSSVHPEAYPVVKRIAEKHGRPIKDLIGDVPFLKSVSAGEFTDDHFGLPTVTDILSELEKPGRDPRPEFKAAEFKEGVETLADLKPGMILEGAVTNVTNFGAFVDIGVHQDGLVHVSALADKFVQDPHEVVKPGDIVKVKVLEVDQPRKRISLTMRLDERHQDKPAATAPGGGGKPRGKGARSQPPRGGGRGQAQNAPQGALGAAFAKALEQKKKGG
ncbi:Tex family protein [Alloalcanivorax mobilis]|uniref:Tex family protein n=1 Tax=Alloalcanivorax mobilis TaxID=2019569 RepID=UPI000C77A001|nr:Tex family protein [Alloalcanivorax mobilis]